MKTKSTTKVLSGSNVTQGTKVLKLQQDVETLKKQIEEINGVLRHMMTTSFDLSNDMQVIYESLNSIAESMAPPEADQGDLLFNPLGIKKDDDLPN